MNLSNDGFGQIWKERIIISNCLDSLGKEELSKIAINPATTQEIINKFLNIIEKEAKATNRHDVLNQLYFAGLIYG